MKKKKNLFLDDEKVMRNLECTQKAEERMKRKRKKI